MITLATGRSAHGLRELRDRVAEVPLDSLRHHFYEHLLRPSFDDPEFRNDFASWAHEALRDEVLAERLSALDPFGERAGEGLRVDLLEILEQRLFETSPAPHAPPGHEFQFLRSQLVVFAAGVEARTISELAMLVPRLSLGSVYYHFVDSRLRPPFGKDDFSTWLSAQGARGEGAALALESIDVQFGSLADLRSRVATALAAEIA